MSAPESAFACAIVRPKPVMRLTITSRLAPFALRDTSSSTSSSLSSPGSISSMGCATDGMSAAITGGSASCARRFSASSRSSSDILHDLPRQHGAPGSTGAPHRIAFGRDERAAAYTGEPPPAKLPPA